MEVTLIYLLHKIRRLDHYPLSLLNQLRVHTELIWSFRMHGDFSHYLNKCMYLFSPVLTSGFLGFWMNVFYILERGGWRCLFDFLSLWSFKSYTSEILFIVNNCTCITVCSLLSLSKLDLLISGLFNLLLNFELKYEVL